MWAEDPQNTPPIIHYKFRAEVNLLHPAEYNAVFSDSTVDYVRVLLQVQTKCVTLIFFFPLRSLINRPGMIFVEQGPDDRG